MATAVLVKHAEVERNTDCQGVLISTYLNNTKCSECDKYLSNEVVLTAADRITDHRTFYGLAVVLISEDDEGEDS